ncbi:MAG: hypothetical protein E7290_13155 [Lachnospiraceae bacterium]|nr:hypothetical protein [Lachnospiraceae bacterium]
MNQEAFIREFQEALAGKVPDNIIRENTEYYRNYIRTQMNQGMTEEEVLRALGDPRLLAKTVVESHKFSNEGQSSYTEYRDTAREQGNYYSEELQESKMRKVPGWLIAVLVILILFAVLKLAFSVLVFFAPIIIMGAVIFFAIRVLKNIFGS